MREVTLQFVRRFSGGDPGRLRDAKELLTRLTRVWRGSSGRALPERYADLYGAVDAEIEQVKAHTRAPIPCARGCNHCCKFNEIYVSKFEAVLLVRHIENLLPDRRAQVVARIHAAATTSGGGHSSPCVLLDEDGCSVYSSRPLPCRGYYSLSEPACSQRLNLGGADPANLAAARVVEFAALEISGSDRQPPFEVNTLLHRIYADPAKAARWAAGDATDESDLAAATVAMK
jgi:hypothetical protein